MDTHIKATKVKESMRNTVTYLLKAKVHCQAMAKQMCLHGSGDVTQQ
jgi:hypothetical protein